MTTEHCTCENCTGQCRDCTVKTAGCEDNCPFDESSKEKAASVQPAELGMDQVVASMVEGPHEP